VTAIAHEFERIYAKFAEALIACRAKAGSQAVHRLRKLTRMTEALLRKAMEDHPNACDLQRRAAKAAKELKRIRRAAGPVRDLDVQRKIANEMRDRTLRPETRSSLMREQKQLDVKLGRRRGIAEKKLKELLAERELKVGRALEKTAKIMQTLRTPEPGLLATAEVWVRQIPLPATEPESLHSYRKKTKAARYLAGMDKGSAPAHKLELRLKQMQDAIGRWHDLLLLGNEAKDLLGNDTCISIVLKSAQEKALKKAERCVGLNE
jgi:CHAD domain-containing protein